MAIVGRVGRWQPREAQEPGVNKGWKAVHVFDSTNALTVLNVELLPQSYALAVSDILQLVFYYEASMYTEILEEWQRNIYPATGDPPRALGA